MSIGNKRRKFQYVPINHADPDDCTIRSISIAMNQDYNLVAKQLKNMAEDTDAEDYRDWDNVKAYLNEQGFVKIKRLKSMRRVKHVAKRYNLGAYVVTTPGHLTAIVDGTVYDVWPTLDERVYNIFYYVPN